MSSIRSTIASSVSSYHRRKAPTELKLVGLFGPYRGGVEYLAASNWWFLAFQTIFYLALNYVLAYRGGFVFEYEATHLPA